MLTWKSSVQSQLLSPGKQLRRAMEFVNAVFFRRVDILWYYFSDETWFDYGSFEYCRY
jgi:hypothetical protein